MSRAGLRSGPAPDNVIYLVNQGAWVWGRFAPRRGASPLTTTALASLATTVHAPTRCSEQACPALGCEAALKPGDCFCLTHRSVWRGDAWRPSAGQARSPQPHTRKLSHDGACPPSRCGEQACPALGCEAALNLSTVFAWPTAVSAGGTLRAPARGKPAHYRSLKFQGWLCLARRSSPSCKAGNRLLLKLFQRSSRMVSSAAMSVLSTSWNTSPESMPLST